MDVIGRGLLNGTKLLGLERGAVAIYGDAVDSSARWLETVGTSCLLVSGLIGECPRSGRWWFSHAFSARV
jgi:hypothetical protein